MSICVCGKFNFSSSKTTHKCVKVYSRNSASTSCGGGNRARPEQHTIYSCLHRNLINELTPIKKTKASVYRCKRSGRLARGGKLIFFRLLIMRKQLKSISVSSHAAKICCYEYHSIRVSARLSPISQLFFSFSLTVITISNDNLDPLC